MGEIDTKPIEPVQVALSLFGEKGDQKKHRPGSCEQIKLSCVNNEESQLCSSCWNFNQHTHDASVKADVDKERDIESLQKDLANYRLQLEAKDSAYMQTLLGVEKHTKAADELSTLLKNSEVEREKYREEYQQARIHVEELESKMNEMADQLAETAKVREQLSHALNELKVAQAELLSMETELAAARDLQLKATTRAELMEIAAKTEREEVEELLKNVMALNDSILMAKLVAAEAEKEKCAILLEKDAEIESARSLVVQAQEQLEDMRSKLEKMQELEDQNLTKTTFINELQVELEQANQLISSSKKATSDTISDLNNLKSELEIKEREYSDQAFCIEALELETKELRLKLKNADEEVDQLKSNVDMLTSELEKRRTELVEVKERENEAQVEIALLKSELHKGKSKIAAAEAAEARAQSVRSGLYLAVEQLAVEAEEARKENERLKQGADKVAEETEISVVVDPPVENYSQDPEVDLIDDSKVDAEERRDYKDALITISLEEYESLIRKMQKADKIPDSPAENVNGLPTMAENKHEVEALKKELESATVKIGELRTRAEQATTRAAAAEKAKAAVEDQLRKWREQKQKRQAAIAALREESAPKHYDSPEYKKAPKRYQPLGKVLNMKF